MKLIIDVDKKLVCEGFERTFTEEERDILIRAIGNGVEYVEPKKGEWIDNGQGFHFCKSCGYFALYQTHDTKTYFEKLSDCCPHCGARLM